MRKHFFISVRTYKSVNSMGEALAHYVEKKYHHTVVAADRFDDIVKDIREKQTKLEKEFPRCRPFNYNRYTTKDRYGHEAEHVYVKPESTYNDNVVYALDTEVIRNDVEVKGGEV